MGCKSSKPVHTTSGHVLGRFPDDAVKSLKETKDEVVEMVKQASDSLADTVDKAPLIQTKSIKEEEELEKSLQNVPEPLDNNKPEETVVLKKSQSRGAAPLVSELPASTTAGAPVVAETTVEETTVKVEKTVN